MKKCTVIINPTSGKGLNQKLAEKIKNVLAKYDYESDIYITEYRLHAEKIASETKNELIISFGGDGTFYEVMNGNFKREKPAVLSHIPVGTTNDIGHMYGLTKSLIGNLELVMNGVVKEIDICSINNRSFVYVASFGKFMEIPYETPQKLKRRLGHFAYVLSGVKSLFKRTPKIEVTYEIDGKKHHGKYTFLIISNANRIAGINNFYNEVKLDDGKYEVMFCSISNIFQIAKAFYVLKTSDISYINGVETYKTDNLKITFKNNNNPWCLDGEKYNNDSLEYVVDTSKKIQMLIPTKNVDKLFTK